MTCLVHIIEDDPGVRRALTVLLKANGYRAETFASAEAFLDPKRRDRPDCIVIDIGLPGMDGVALIRELHRRGSSPPMVVLTGRGDVASAVSAMRAGAFDFLEKPCDSDELLGALKAAIEGAEDRDDDPSVGPDADDGACDDTLHGLTPREREVLREVVAGLPNKMIAHRLGVSPKTIEVHRARVMRKTGARSLPELIRFALKAESVDQP